MSEAISIWHLYVWAGTACAALAAALVAVWRANGTLADRFIKALEKIVAENKAAMDGVASRLEVLESRVSDHVVSKQGCVEEILGELRPRRTYDLFDEHAQKKTAADEYTHGR